MQARMIYLALILAGLSTGAHAGLNKCKGANGHIILQDAPCPLAAGTPIARMPTLAERNALVTQQKREAKQQPYADSRPGSNWEVGRKPGERMNLGQPDLPAKLIESAPVRSSTAPERSESRIAREIREQNEKTSRDNVRTEAQNRKTNAQNRITECDNARRRLSAAQEDSRPPATLASLQSAVSNACR
jgi:hypothetical protein